MHSTPSSRRRMVSAGLVLLNTPGRIPCTYIAVTPAMAGGGDNKVPMAEFVCLHKLLSQ